MVGVGAFGQVKCVLQKTTRDELGRGPCDNFGSVTRGKESPSVETREVLWHHQKTSPKNRLNDRKEDSPYIYF